MKKLSFLLVTLFLLSNHAQCQYRWWGGYTVDTVVNISDLVFEGRILTDSVFFQRSPGGYFTVHNVLVLKKFKGTFKSDTVKVVTYGGKMIRNDEWDGSPTYAFKGDEAVFLVVNSTKVDLGGSDSTVYDPFYGPGISYVTICNKKDVVKEVYQPIENVIGHPYEDVRPNNCKKQPQKK